MDGFTADRAWVYLVALSLWVAGLAIVVVRYGGAEPVTTVASALQLTVMFVAAAAIVGVAVLMTCDHDLNGNRLPGLRPDYLQAAIGLTWRSWLLLVGAGVPAAVRAFRK